MLSRFKALKASPEELEQINLAMQNADARVATETRAMRLVLEAQEVPKSSMHPVVAAWQLGAEDIKRSAEDKMKVARHILFDAQYEAKLRIIIAPIAQFQNMINAQAAGEVQAAQSQIQIAAVVLIVLMLLMVIGAGTVLWVLQIRWRNPIAKYISELQQQDAQALDVALTPAGCQELRGLAEAVNQQFQIKQQHLKEYRQLIADIVQVSQGLAEGNLQVMPTAEYRGDFALIKNALDLTLTRLRQVIADIVQVAQGLAEDNWHVRPTAEYQGDFIQIKNALESTVAKLAETMAKNSEQDWLKTGQTEANEKMRGELEPIMLTQNILNYLADYVDAQVGVFFLAEEEHFKLVSSYAYKQRGNNYNEFKLGEGLIGQAALEKKSILFSQAPEEHLNLSINSGMGESKLHDIFVQPLLYENQVLGVLELATARHFTPTDIELLERVADNIAITLHSAQSRLRMQAVLDESQQLTLTLQTQQQELVESEERIRAIVDTIIDGVITIDELGIIESFNKAAEQIFGYQKSEMIGQNISPNGAYYYSQRQRPWK